MKTNVNDGTIKVIVTKLIEGAQLYAESIPLPADFETSLTTDVNRLDAAINAHVAHKKAERLARSARNAALLRGRQFVTNTIQVLKPHLGNSYNTSWQEAGLSDGSIAIPRTLAEIVRQVDSFKNYLTLNPTHESAGANITAAAATATAQAMTDAEGALQAALVDSRLASEQRIAARDLMAKRLRIATETLSTKLSDTDARWLGFGIPRPIDTRTPEVPVKPVLQQIGPGSIELTWTKAVRARRYRIFLQAAADAEPRAIQTVPTLYAVLRDLPTGIKLTFTLVAANGSGESQPGEPAEITLS